MEEKKLSIPQEKKIALQRRIHEAYNYLIAGIPKHEIIKGMMHDYKVTDRTVSGYIAHALKIFKENAAKTMEQAMDEHIGMYMAIYADCFRGRRYKDALEALKQIDKLRGIGTTKIDITSNGKPFETIIQIVSNKDVDTDETNKV